MKFNALTVILFSLGLMAISLVAINSSSAEVVGIWLFDDGAGDVAMDSSGNNNHGTIVNAPIWVDGRFGGALGFDGTGNCVSTNKRLLNGKREFTIVAWVKKGNITSNRIGIMGQNDSPEFGFINPTTVALWTPSAGINNNPYPHPSNEWHHVAAVATREFTKVYVDGEATEKTGRWSNHGRSDFNVNIGGCGVWDGTGNWFTGAMDEVGLFHSPLSDDDINDLMNNGLTALGVAVEPAGKIAVTWGMLKRKD
ncbi:MAG: LamG domain-containing protein [Candidatus Poribacteria bacterium]|nr:LamG domain-containing protein [Candidatus Poribacteria bacterium]